MDSLTSAKEVLLLFTIPIGGGIPAGIVLAESRNIAWPFMMALYFISDVLLACVFEPVMWLALARAKRSRHYSRLNEAFKKMMEKLTSHYGTSLGPLALVAITVGTDPMTGRSITAARGHGFLSGWLIAITGDMIYFTLIMASTLWLNGILGDGTQTTLIILAAMIFVPPLVRKAFPHKRPRQTR